MGTMKAAMTVLRSLALLCTVISFALGVWSKLSRCLSNATSDICTALVIVQVIDNRGETVLSALKSSLGADANLWSQYIRAAARGTAWICVIIVTVSRSFKTFNSTDQRRVR